jgi:indole-3-glycerol phosphate synthase/phosphoribosylanthranilate isomerase
LVPASIRSKLPAKAVFESGIHSGADAAYARSLGFTGILVGEAVAKNPPLAKEVVGSFENGSENAKGKFWKNYAERRASLPMVKICGITRVEDGLLAAELGADMLGFVFSTTKRLTTEEFVRSFSTKLRASRASETTPLLVGVITDPESVEGKTAIKLAREGVLDAVQFHGVVPGAEYSDLPHYCAARVGEDSDFDKVAALRKSGEPRILLDAKVEGIPGGTGKQIPESLLREKAGDIPLWLAGGINPENVAGLVSKFGPELVDVSSGVEDAPGVKNADKLKALFAALLSV